MTEPQKYEGKVDFTPEWLMEWEKEQGDKMVILRRQVQAKRDYIFAESMYGRREHRKEMQAMVGAYEIVLSLLDNLTSSSVKRKSVWRI